MKVTSKRDHRYRRLDGVFPTEDNRCQENRKSFNHLSCHRSSSLAAARTNHRTAGLNGTDRTMPVVQERILHRFVVKIYRETSVLLCAVSFISVVEPQFLYV
jgi:hypothetical protein